MAMESIKVAIENNGQRPAGFTLIELLIAMVILTIGLLGTAGLTMGIIRGNFYSKNITSATVIAQTQLESVQNSGYTNATTTNFPASPATVSMGGVDFSRTTTITNDSPATNMKTVSITVSWNEANNATRTVTLQTILSQ
jgi:prepilin-type N-terminal cleavage/methylation domain-containing protein